jgi:hypothetical protein
MTNATLHRASVLALVLGVTLSTGFAVTAATAASASVDHEGDALTLRAESGQTVSGTTSLSGDAEVTVRLRGAGDSAFLQSATTTTDDAGDFEATFDLGDVDAADAGPVTVTVRHDGTTLTTVDAQLDASETADGGSSGTGPGFGIAAALGAAALLGATALARRR